MSENTALQKIGAIWVRENKTGETYFSGEVEDANGTKIPFIAFENKFKKTDKHPDFVVYYKEPRENTGTKYPKQQSKAPYSRPTQSQGYKQPTQREPNRNPQRTTSNPYKKSGYGNNR